MAHNCHYCAGEGCKLLWSDLHYSLDSESLWRALNILLMFFVISLEIHVYLHVVHRDYLK